jgi:hypothetical protein
MRPRTVPRSPVRSIDLPAEFPEVEAAAFELVEVPVAETVPLTEVTDIVPVPEVRLGDVMLAEELDDAEAELAAAYVVEVKEHLLTRSLASTWFSTSAILSPGQHTVVLAVFAVLVKTSSTVRNALRCARVIAYTFHLSRIVVMSVLVATGSQADNRSASVFALGRDIVCIHVLSHNGRSNAQQRDDEDRTHYDQLSTLKYWFVRAVNFSVMQSVYK